MLWPIHSQVLFFALFLLFHRNSRMIYLQKIDNTQGTHKEVLQVIVRDYLVLVTCIYIKMKSKPQSDFLDSNFPIVFFLAR